jgi:hypothetical protein
MNVGGTPNGRWKSTPSCRASNRPAIDVQTREGACSPSPASASWKRFHGKDAKATIHIDERYAGRFRRVS